MQRELRLKFGARGEDLAPLGCPVDGCGDSSGRITRVEVLRDAPSIDGSVSVGFECGRGHKWHITIDERDGQLVYAARAIGQWARLPE